MTVSLVTGGNGYFGRVLVDQLAARGDQVRVLDIDTDGLRPDVEAVTADIRDGRRVREAVDGVDAVFHNVAQVPLSRDGAFSLDDEKLSCRHAPPRSRKYNVGVCDVPAT